jgi:PD-(D/E)XK nuclease superfamily
MVSGFDNISLLKSLLAAGDRSSPNRVDSNAALLGRILALAPKIIRPQRKSNLFEAIHILDLENPHSDYLAWLLDPLGPLTGNWLLKSLLERIAPNASCDGDLSVKREVVVEEGRLDILLTWNSYKLIIENKVWSQEGDHQVARYLSSCSINDPLDGCVVYLSPYGERPRSVGLKDERVAAMSYGELARLVDYGLDSGKEPNSRGYVFAAEFRECIKLLLKVRYDTVMPKISDSSAIYIDQARRIGEIRSLAVTEFQEFLDWMYGQIEQRLKSIVGDEIVSHRGSFGVLFRLPDWNRGNVVFGFDFALYNDSTKTLVTESVEGPFAGIGAWSIPDRSDRKSSKYVVDLLTPVLREFWPLKKEVSHPDWRMALWRELKILESENVEEWSKRVVECFAELAKALTPILKNAAKSIRLEEFPDSPNGVPGNRTPTF